MNGELLARIRQIWETARTQAVRSVNSAHVCANWLIGQQIVEAEQGGAERAEYGTQLLPMLSEQLTKEYGTGFSLSTIKYMRLFYLNYPALLPIRHAARDELDNAAVNTITLVQQALSTTWPQTDGTTWKPGHLYPGLSWTYYRALLKVEHQTARNFYEIEAVKNGWSARQLERQINMTLAGLVAQL